MNNWVDRIWNDFKVVPIPLEFERNLWIYKEWWWALNIEQWAMGRYSKSKLQEKRMVRVNGCIDFKLCWLGYDLCVRVWHGFHFPLQLSRDTSFCFCLWFLFWYDSKLKSERILFRILDFNILPLIMSTPLQ